MPGTSGSRTARHSSYNAERREFFRDYVTYLRRVGRSAQELSELEEPQL